MIVLPGIKSRVCVLVFSMGLLAFSWPTVAQVGPISSSDSVSGADLLALDVVSDAADVGGAATRVAVRCCGAGVDDAWRPVDVLHLALTGALVLVTGVSAASAYLATRSAAQQVSDARFAARFSVTNAFEAEADKESFGEVLQIGDDDLCRAGLTRETLRMYLLVLNRMWAALYVSDLHHKVKRETDTARKQAVIRSHPPFWRQDSVQYDMLRSEKFRVAWDGMLKRFWHSDSDSAFVPIIEFELSEGASSGQSARAPGSVVDSAHESGSVE